MGRGQRQDPGGGSIALVSMLRTLGVGEDPEHPMPQEEGVEAVPVAAAGSAGAAVTQEALTLLGLDGPLQRGALTDTLSLLPRLEVDFSNAEVRLVVEHARLSTGWHQLNASIKEVRGEAKAVRTEGRREAVEAKATCASALAEKEALVKRCEEAEASFKALQEAT
ncbi:hypothetical protein D1007_22798 [Hordeum vulgare]|nr:hypothetical protein D1007_22798 [Hordeum vulgare]